MSTAAMLGFGESAAWRFVTELYARPGIAAHCLALQDDYGVDVTALLYAVFVGSRGLRFADPAEIDRVSGDWRNTVVGGLRRARRRLKRASEPGARALYRRVLGDELAAERIALDLLENQLRLVPDATPGAAARAYLRHCGAPQSALAPLLSPAGGGRVLP